MKGRLRSSDISRHPGRLATSLSSPPASFSARGNCSMERMSKYKKPVENASSSGRAKHYVVRFFLLPFKDEHLAKPKLPAAFVDEHRDDVVGVCVFQTPDGLKYSVKVNEYKGGLYLDEGWATFKGQYNISKGYVIVFQYMGGAQFNVVLLDLSMTEICYKTVNTVKSEPEDDYSMDDAIGQKNAGYVGRFFQILQPMQMLQTARLAKAFSRKYKSELMGGCILNIPDGSKVTVGVKEDGNRLYFADGWANLCDRYGLLVGSLVVLQYIGRAKFDVIIFGISTMEIKYNIAMPIGRRLQAVRGRPPGDVTTLVSAHACFTIVVTESCLQRNGQLWVPKVHREDWLDDFDGNEVQLIYGAEQGIIGLIRSTAGMRFGHGWSEFATRCSFSAQSECIFELIDSLRMVYRVHLY